MLEIPRYLRQESPRSGERSYLRQKVDCCPMVESPRCYVGELIKGVFRDRWEIPSCIACCYSIVPVFAGRSGNKFALQSGTSNGNRISLWLGACCHSQRGFDRDFRWTFRGCGNSLSPPGSIIPLSQFSFATVGVKRSRVEALIGSSLPRD